MFHKKRGLIAVVLLVLVCCGCKNSVTGNSISVQKIPEENGSISVFFCPRDNCSGVLASELALAHSYIHCAWYDVDSPEIIEAVENLSGISASLVIEKDNLQPLLKKSIAKYDTSSYLMHNKFCVIDGNIVITGSTNPTGNDLKKNKNNLLIIQSRYLAENYQQEFQELWGGIFGKGNPVKYPKVIINGILVETLFCPEDGCAGRVVGLINGAKHSIYFMTFSFTDDSIGNAIMDSQALDIRGIFDRSQNDAYSELPRLQKTGFDVRKNPKGYKLHHKVFIIDNATVITGSYNPTKGGTERNDENMIVIHDADIASQFCDEFDSIYSVSS